MSKAWKEVKKWASESYGVEYLVIQSGGTYKTVQRDLAAIGDDFCFCTTKNLVEAETVYDDLVYNMKGLEASEASEPTVTTFIDNQKEANNGH